MPMQKLSSNHAQRSRPKRWSCAWSGRTLLCSTIFCTSFAENTGVPIREKAKKAPPLRVFAYADRGSPDLSIYASSLESIGTRLNVLGLDDSKQSSEELKELRDAVAKPLASQAAHRSNVTAVGQRETSLQGAERYRLLRKFFSLRPHLASFADDEVLLFSDGYDVKVEAHSTSHVRDAFEHIQRRYQSHEDLPWGPVIFSGESNCWPFPHPWSRQGKDAVYISGDYRPDYVYLFDKETRLRGDEICEFWQSKQPHGQTDTGPIHLPFPNSGVFIGRVGSLRRLFVFAIETLQLFGDFRDQALLYSMLLRIFVQRLPPMIHVDVAGELLATVHGLDIDALADQLDVARCCDYGSWYKHGNNARRLQSGSISDRPKTLPLVLHFSGSAKWFYQHQCNLDLTRQFFFVGARFVTVGFVDYDQQKGVHCDYHLPLLSPEKRDEASVWIVRLPWQPNPLTLMELVGMVAQVRKGHADLRLLRYALLAKPGRPQLMQELDLQKGKRATRWISFRASADVLHDGYSLRHKVQAAKVFSKGLNAVHIQRNLTSCSKYLHGAYCRLYSTLCAAWKRLQPASPRSAGLFWIDFYSRDLKAAQRNINLDRPSVECGIGSGCTRKATGLSRSPAKQGKLICPAWAALDFAESLESVEGSRFQMVRPLQSALFVRKSGVRWLGGGNL